MCFSAPASFIASGGLVVLGGASMAMAKKEDKLLALVPIMFAIQQALEGVQWLYLNTGTVSLWAGYGYLFFAFIVWPIYVPTFVYVIDKKRRNILKYFVMLGVATGLYFLYLLLTQSLHIRELSSCVSYTFENPLNDFANLAYITAVFSPLFISTHKGFKLFGIVTAISFIVTLFFFYYNFTSVWCFFAAVISSMFFVYIKTKNHRKKIV